MDSTRMRFPNPPLKSFPPSAPYARAHREPHGGGCLRSDFIRGVCRRSLVRRQRTPLKAVVCGFPDPLCWQLHMPPARCPRTGRAREKRLVGATVVVLVLSPLAGFFCPWCGPRLFVYMTVAGVLGLRHVASELPDTLYSSAIQRSLDPLSSPSGEDLQAGTGSSWPPVTPFALFA